MTRILGARPVRARRQGVRFYIGDYFPLSPETTQPNAVTAGGLAEGSGPSGGSTPPSATTIKTHQYFTDGRGTAGGHHILVPTVRLSEGNERTGAGLLRRLRVVRHIVRVVGGLHGFQEWRWR